MQDSRSSGSSRCCESGQPIAIDPATGSTICSCQMQAGVPAYLSRVPRLPESFYGPMVKSHGNAESQAYYPSYTADRHLDSRAAVPGMTPTYLGHTMAPHPYNPYYPDYDLMGVRRKNATRETTGPLKSWLYQHRKNPYPSKAEKVMLAIITQMTLTQVSTWFANARRRLKKENKMTWSPRNRSEEDGSGDEDMDTKTNGNDSDVSNLNTSLDDVNDDNRSTADHLDRIISVDDDEESDQSDIDDLENARNLSKHGTDADKPHSDKIPDNRLDGDSPKPEVSSHGDAKSDAVNLSRLSDSKSSPVSGTGTSEAQSSRPKIWSVLDVLGNKDKDKDSSSGTSAPSTHTSPAVVCSRQTNGSSYLNLHHTNQNFRNGQFPVGFNGYPFSLSHTTLSYPYTLSASTASKAELSMKHAAAMRATEQAFKEGLVEKAARLQERIFSPARDVDGLRVGGKMVL